MLLQNFRKTRLPPPLPLITTILSYFTLSLLFSISINIITSGLCFFSFGKLGHLLITTITLALFLYTQHKRSLISTIGFWIFIALPILVIQNIGQPDGRTVKEVVTATTEGNLFTINISILLATLLAVSSYFSSPFSRKVARAFTCLAWSIALLPPASFYCYWLFADSIITANTLIALFQTTPAEAIEYASFRGIKFISGLITLALLFLTANITLFLLRKEEPPKTNHLILLAIIIASSFGIYKTSSNYLTYPITDAVIGIQEFNSYKEGFLHREKNIQPQLQSTKKQGDDGLFVVVIGESQTKTHMSAYGYDKSTTPWLKSKLNSNNFIILNNTYSSYIATVPALSQALTASNQYSSLQLEKAPSILEIANTAGYETWWFSNQNKLGGWDTPTTIIANQANHTEWINTSIGQIIRSQFFDEELIKLIDKIPDTSKKKLVILHTLGCHTNYHSRYPTSFQKFGNNNKTNHYDNAILYQDFVMKTLHEKLISRNDFKALIMISDHGKDPNIGHDPDRFRWDMAEIPFWISFSQNYAEKRSDTIAALKDNHSKAFTNDMFFDFLCGFLNIKDNPYYDAKNDISSDSYSRSEDDMTILGKSKSIKDAKN